MSEWVDCEMSHGPRKRGRVCLSCEALKRVPVLRDRIADLKRQIAEAKRERERDEARADNGRLCMLIKIADELITNENAREDWENAKRIRIM